MMKWFHSLKVAQKLALISIVFIIPDSVMLYLFITSINENIQFARLEKTGNEYQRPLERLLELVPQHRMLTRSNAGDAMVEALISKQQEIDSAFDALEAVDSRIGVTLDFTTEGLAKHNRQGCDVTDVRREWEALKTLSNGTAGDKVDPGHVQLIADIRSMIGQSGDMSNLILDPELDSYYLVDATLMALPQTQDRLASVMASGEDMIRAGDHATAESKVSLAIDLSRLKEDDRDRIMASVQTSLQNGSPNYGLGADRKALEPPALTTYADAAAKFDDLTGKLLTDGPQSVSLKQFLSAGDAARAASFKLWNVSDDNLDSMLQNRIDYYTYRRTRSLGVAAGAVSAALLLVTFITRSISGPLKRQAMELKSVNEALSAAREQLEERVEKSYEALQQTEAKYRSIFENSVMGIFQTSPQGQYISANPALATIYGYASCEDLQNRVQDIEHQLYVNPKRRVEFQAAIAASGTVTDFESEIRRRDGSIRWISETAREVRDSEGVLLYYEGTIKDITQRISAEAAQLRAKQEAEAARAAAELARAAAESANLAKSDFLATMSHEIRTPLNGVIGMIDLIMNTTLTAQQTRYAKVVKSSSDGLLTLINQILDFSKIEAGKLELETESFDSHFAVEEVAAVMSQKAAAKGLELVCRVDPAVPTHVRGDGDRLRQVLTNIVNNAIKFTAKGEVVVRVSVDDRIPATATACERVKLRFAVSDTGIGVPPDRLDRLFKSFSQVDTSTTRQYGGTGLGLAISKQLVELMGGNIGVDSVAGKGSTFWFTAVFEHDEKPKEIDSFSLAGRRVLVVDDNLTQCQLMQEQLSSWKIEAAYATSGSAAIELLQDAIDRNRPFDTMVVDLNMPAMNGIAVSREVRSRPAMASLPLILMSGIDASLDTDTGAFVRCLIKPVRESQLFDSLMVAMVGPKLPVLAPVTKAAIAGSENAPTVALKTMRILLAEDMEVNQFVVNETLARSGYTCDVANNGREAIEAVSKKSYDIVLMDCQMPEVSGFDATTAIRAMERDRGTTPRLPIIALTANAIKGDRERCLATGMDEYLTKPLNPTLLIQTIERLALKTAVDDAVVSAPALATTAAATATSATSAVTSVAVPSASDFEPTVDHAALAARCEGDLGMVSRLAKMFEDKSRKTWDQLQDKYREKDIPATTQLAHALSGTASNLSAVKVARLARQLEELGRAGDLSAAEDLMTRLGVELAKSQEEFRKLATGDSSGTQTAAKV